MGWEAIKYECMTLMILESSHLFFFFLACVSELWFIHTGHFNQVFLYKVILEGLTWFRIFLISIKYWNEMLCKTLSDLYAFLFNLNIFCALWIILLMYVCHQCVYISLHIFKSIFIRLLTHSFLCSCCVLALFW